MLRWQLGTPDHAVCWCRSDDAHAYYTLHIQLQGPNLRVMHPSSKAPKPHHAVTQLLQLNCKDASNPLANAQQQAPKVPQLPAAEAHQAPECRVNWI